MIEIAKFLAGAGLVLAAYGVACLITGLLDAWREPGELEKHALTRWEAENRRLEQEQALWKAVGERALATKLELDKAAVPMEDARRVLRLEPALIAEAHRLGYTHLLGLRMQPKEDRR